MEGSVKIFSLHDYENLSFPELVEITDYIILYNVIGLKSLARIFPNLQVIRGNNLYENYALVIYRMPDLTEVGLKSLTAIVRGGVRIQNNPALCFADTINWVYIANGTQPEDHIIGSNKNGKECPVCRTGKTRDGNKIISNDSETLDFPVFEQDTNKSYCWNSHIPQRICPDHCGQRSCDDQGHCCDETCLGSCNSNNTKLCSVCRNLSVGPLNSRQCVDTCPDGLFMYKQWRCITKEECWNISQPLTLQNTRTNLYIPYDGKCHRMCPENHIAEEDNGRRVCKSCNGECKKECPGGTIEDLSSAQLFRKCAIITGTLIIKIRQRDQSIIKELEQSLSDVEEIGGTLKIVGSYPLISLNFFRKLKVIRGKNARDHYALYVVNNQNLQSLFEQDVTIEEGKILFHFNSKLCYEKIWAIKKNVIDLRETYVLAIEDVAIDSNGNKAACNVEKLMTRVSTVMHFGAIIDVETMHFDDKRVLLGYDLYYKEAPHTNVSIFEGRSVCEDNGWRVEDVTVFDRRAQIVQIILTKLKPYTQYAYYVKTFTIAWEPFGGQSDINYFRTSPSQPGPVQNLEIVAHDSSSISLARIFPNLQVIRGNNLYENYALVIYRMPDLTEVGLKSLTAIVRGGVRIQNNPALCFADTINWVYIANGTQPEDHIIGSNKNGKECPVCRTGKTRDGNKIISNDSETLDFPVFEQDTNKSYCWNSHIPQRICPDHCGQRSCDDQGHCCDETCLGSCNSNNTKLCSVCRNLSVGPLNSRQCVDTCPDGLFMYKQWRCITKEECWNISQPLTLQNTRTNLYIPYDGKCHRMCPENHIAEEDNGRRVCKSCNGECKKECPGGTIEDLSSAQLFRKCAIITGTLIIKIRQRDQSIIKELEQSLSDVEEIGGTLKIVGSYPLISLNFFRKLKVIRGKNARDHYALYVVNNQNLQSLFEQDVTIEEGKILFHFNSKLCYEKIWAIKKNVIDLRETYVLAIEDVAIDSNGNKAACNVEKLMTRVSTVMHFGAIIDVETMHFDDKRVLLGYDLYYKEAPHTNVSIFEGRSVCEDNGWRVEDVTVFDRRAQIVQIILTKLKPYTQYAYYVKTFTIAWEPFGGQSDINYFRTSPSQPGPVQNLEIVAHDSSSITPSMVHGEKGSFK
ncbi:Insulin-like receptor [Pseudolycoriella hygida]|uniref:receptor protein-tyrosine kinase n=1 Tax=Pseudolycoriella hygida TaxID=35572 RepID=A0A9Q0MQF2_9DIPT|nr:Insulin-like receptor [Pseudolycoriella hygida]